MPPRVELLDVPFFPQQEYHCGPAALATLITYRGIPVEPEQIAPMIFVPGLKGSLQAEVVAAARQFDLLPVTLDGTLESLMREVDAGNPVFVLQNLGLDALPVWHYEVVVGYDFDQRVMIMRSGVNRRLTRPFSTFEKTWQRAGYWALAITPPDAVPPTARAEAFIDAVIGMEAVGRTQSANRGYRSAVRRWPGNLLAHMGRGNTAYAMGEFADAEAAYRAALTIDPQRAEAWNNLAYALAQLGRHEASMDAIHRALEIDPDNPEFRHSLGELSAWQ